ncbi:hypothetical protein SY111_00660 [Ligilactobacillus agilis]|uniref:Uncharacterized protein n=1 Tax=Ligilactobacillus agilis TaxID=1601 RepID=A0A6F9Y175_9LACO|nr:hypothetical protein [Ligilactobacillus agilis]GET06172.1 hypothetical protein SY212_12020 [Ligilactobacillus agilis]GET07442.1 hypothetical protein SY111_00660 [Ligilactobacillus agilis]GET11242.1 hypothetical protein SN10121_17320 [Ligilactobacillus agilis]
MALQSEIRLRGISKRQKELIKTYTKKLGYHSQSEFILATLEKVFLDGITGESGGRLNEQLGELIKNNELLLSNSEMILIQEDKIFEEQRNLKALYENWLNDLLDAEEGEEND